MRRALSGAVIAVVWAMIGCGAAATTTPPAVAVNTPPGALPPAAKKGFEDGLAAMARHDRDNDWSDAACKATTDLFLVAGGRGSATALYNAGLAQQRCKKDTEAKDLFQAALEKDPRLFGARASLAMYAAQPGGKGIDHAISELQKAVIDARFTSVDALVALGTLELRRGNTTPDADGADDYERAKKSLHRALAIDDRSMPAYNQLAIYYLDTGKRGAAAHKVDRQALELAALVCSQAIRKEPRYAPVHNTAGLVEVELGNLSRAVAEFNEARRLDPSFFEAHMNSAAVNLRFRGFVHAEEAYRAALKIRSSDYDALLGLALSIRGQINEENEARLVTAAAQEIEAAKKIAPDRPEAYYNDAILTQEYGAKAGGPSAKAALVKAKGLLSTFLAKAAPLPGFAEEKQRAGERMHEIDQILIFVDGAPAAPAPG